MEARAKKVVRMVVRTRMEVLFIFSFYYKMGGGRKRFPKAKKGIWIQGEDEKKK